MKCVSAKPNLGQNDNINNHDEKQLSLLIIWLFYLFIFQTDICRVFARSQQAISAPLIQNILLALLTFLN
jgi:hypothetical protein